MLPLKYGLILILNNMLLIPHYTYDSETRSFSAYVTLYHYTDPNNLESIQKNGILGSYATKEGTRSMNTKLPKSELRGLVYLTRSKTKNPLEQLYKGLVEVRIPKEEFDKLTIVSDPFLKLLQNKIGYLDHNMKVSNDFKWYMFGQMDQVIFNRFKNKKYTREQLLKNTAAYAGIEDQIKLLDPKNTIVIKGDIPPEWIYKVERS